jgi:hypothetical protein
VSQLYTPPELEPGFRDYEPIQPEPGWKALARKLWARSSPSVPSCEVRRGSAQDQVPLDDVRLRRGLRLDRRLGVRDRAHLLLFVHEMGTCSRPSVKGLPVSAPMFIPFLGAMITMRELPHDAWREARIGIAGPLLARSGGRVYAVGVAYDSRSLKAIAFLGFLINLFNLLPASPLDGGRIAAALHPSMWFSGSSACSRWWSTARTRFSS